MRDEVLRDETDDTIAGFTLIRCLHWVWVME